MEENDEIKTEVLNTLDEIKTEVLNTLEETKRDISSVLQYETRDPIYSRACECLDLAIELISMGK